VRSLVFLLALVTSSAAAQVATLRPVDQATGDPAFITFRGRLLAARSRPTRVSRSATMTPAPMA
jgi:hypothetical protein